MSEIETKQIWIVWTNTDLTEGRGRQVPIAFCESRTTADRLSLGKGVQGGCADVLAFTSVKHNGYWCAPFQIITPTKDDLDKDKVRDELNGIIYRARSLGMTEDELKIIARGLPK